MKVVLELQDQPSNVRRVTVRHDIVIGRGADCNLRLSAPQISRRHCFLRVGRDGVSVTDLDSSNGTFVDGQRLKSGIRQPLVNGSQLSIGPIRFLIHVRDEAVSGDVLKTAGSKEQKATSQKSSDPSTVVADPTAILRNARAMNLALEQAGAASDSHDVTSDFPGTSATASKGASAEAAKQRAAQLPEVDSRAEIVDLGRQLVAEEEVARDQKFGSPSKKTAATAKSPVAESPPINSPKPTRSAIPDVIAPVASVVAGDMAAQKKDVAKPVSTKQATKPPAPSAEDFDAPEDLSFFGDETAEKTVTPLNRQDSVEVVEEIFDVAEVVEELPEESIEVVDDEIEEVIEVADVFDVADVVEEVADVEEVFDVVESTNSGNVMSLDDDWNDPDDLVPVRRSSSSKPSQPMKLSSAARGASGSASTPKKDKNVVSQSPAAKKQTASSTASMVPPVLPPVPVMNDPDVVEVVDEYEDVVDVEEVAVVEEVFDVVDVEPLAEELPVDVVEQAEVFEAVEEAEVVEIHDFFNAAEPDVDIVDLFDEPLSQADARAAEVIPVASESESPWSDLASEQISVEDSSMDVEAPIAVQDAVADSNDIADAGWDPEVESLSEVSIDANLEPPVSVADAADVVTDAQPESELAANWLTDESPSVAAEIEAADDSIADWLQAEDSELEAVVEDLDGSADVAEVVDGVDALQVDDVLEASEIEVVDELIEPVEAVEAADPESSWFTDDAEESSEPVDSGIEAEDVSELKFGEQNESDDEIDPGLRDFLKGF